MSEQTKLRLVKLTWPTGAVEITDLDGFLSAAKDYIGEGEIGDEWHLEFIEMDQEAYDNLPEFAGP